LLSFRPWRECGVGLASSELTAFPRRLRSVFPRPGDDWDTASRLFDAVSVTFDEPEIRAGYDVDTGDALHPPCTSPKSVSNTGHNSWREKVLVDEYRLEHLSFRKPRTAGKNPFDISMLSEQSGHRTSLSIENMSYRIELTGLT
jgi:hypothetical protein